MLYVCPAPAEVYRKLATQAVHLSPPLGKVCSRMDWVLCTSCEQGRRGAFLPGVLGQARALYGWKVASVQTLYKQV